jgi:hypothetical protein
LPERKYSVILKIRLDHELYEQLEKEAKKHDTDISTYMKWCAQTGLYLEDLSSFIGNKVKRTDVASRLLNNNNGRPLG